MSDEQLNVHIGDTTREVIFRTGSAEPIYEPQILTIVGQIETPLVFYNARKSLSWPGSYNSILPTQAPYFAKEKCHVIVDRQSNLVTLKINETDRFPQIITGRLTVDPIFDTLGINANLYRSPAELGKLLRSHRYLFADKSEGEKIVSALLSFKAKIETDIESEKKQTGNKHQLLNVNVNSGLPESFKLNLPLFKGKPPKSTIVELVVDTSGHSVVVGLESIEAIELFNTQRDEIIGGVVETFIADGFAVIEI